jgi:hypothetical protein
MKIFEKYLWADFLYCCMVLFRFGWFCTILFLVWKRDDCRYVAADEPHGGPYILLPLVVIVGQRIWRGIGQSGMPDMCAAGPAPESLPSSETLSA